LSHNEWFKKRFCYHPIYGKESYKVSIPIFDEIQRSRPISSEEKEFTEEDLLDWLYDLQENNFPDAPAFELLQRFIKKPGAFEKGEVCLTGLIDFELGEIIDLESACHNYHCLPYAGGLFDQPIKLIETFNVIRATRNKYDNLKIEQITKDVKNNPDSSKKPLNIPKIRR